MPYCPQCREEYETTVKACAQCGAALVAQLPPAEPDQDEVQVLNLPGPAEAELVLGILRQEGVRARVEARETENLVPFLYTRPITGPVGVSIVVPSAELQRAREVLAEQHIHADISPAEMARLVEDRLAPALAGDAADRRRLADELVEQPRNIRWAVLGAAGAEEGGVALLQDLLLAGLSQEEGGLRWDAARLLNDLAPVETRGLLFDHVAAGRPKEERIRAADALGYMRGVGAERDLVALLEDPDPDLRDQALDALFFLTLRTFDFDPSVDPADPNNQAALDRWKRSVQGLGPESGAP